MNLEADPRARDVIVMASAAGMIASLAKDAPNMILYWLGAAKVLYWHLAASAIVRPRYVYTLLGVIVGALADLALGGALGILILLVLRRFGNDWWWYKGMIAGIIIWLVGFSLGIQLLAGIRPDYPAFALEAAVEHQFFGLAAVFLVGRWGGPGECAGVG